MIHQYKNNGYNIVMDVNSGSVHVVDDLIYDMVEVLEKELPELEKPETLPAEAVEKTVAALKAVKYGVDADFASRCVVTTTLISLITVPLLMLLL